MKNVQIYTRTSNKVNLWNKRLKLFQAPIDEVKDAVFWAIEAGYRHIDTAAVYGDEEQVGQGIAEAISKGLVKREELFVTTKVRYK